MPRYLPPSLATLPDDSPRAAAGSSYNDGLTAVARSDFKEDDVYDEEDDDFGDGGDAAINNGGGGGVSSARAVARVEVIAAAEEAAARRRLLRQRWRRARLRWPSRLRAS